MLKIGLVLAVAVSAGLIGARLSGNATALPAGFPEPMAVAAPVKAIPEPLSLAAPLTGERLANPGS